MMNENTVAFLLYSEQKSAMPITQL